MDAMEGVRLTVPIRHVRLRCCYYVTSAQAEYQTQQPGKEKIEAIIIVGQKASRFQKRSKTAKLKIHKTEPIEPEVLPVGATFRCYTASHPHHQIKSRRYNGM